jgi:hypothetical protein
LLLALLTLAAPLADETWRCHEEVYRLDLLDGTVVAQTSGGTVRREGGRWIEASASPSATPPAPNPAVVWQGQRLTSQWGGQFLEREGKPAFRRPPTAGDYALLNDGRSLLAGTEDGLWQLAGTTWSRLPLPSKLPTTRVHGYASVGGWLAVGGPQGLYTGRPLQWNRVNQEPVRNLMAHGEAVWVLYGSGAVDKIEPGRDRLYADVLHGSAKRPWTSCLGSAGPTVLFGGHGGWIERDGSLVERYPAELAGDVVTAIAGSGKTRWVGTQKQGLVEFTGKRVRRWNPGTGLPDTWVTALQPTPTGLVVATATEGLFLLMQGKLKRIPSPSSRPRSLLGGPGWLAVGATDGAWLRHKGQWKKLSTGGEETTALTTKGNRLAVSTAKGIHFITLPAPSAANRL